MSKPSFSIIRSSRMRLAGFASAAVLASLPLVAGAWAAAVPSPQTPLVLKPQPPAAAPAAPTAAPQVTVAPSVAARPQGYADLAERLLPMVVNISTSQTLRRAQGAQNNGTQG